MMISRRDARRAYSDAGEFMALNLERISFITPFDSSEEPNQPTLNFTCNEFPARLSIDFRVGMIGLKPNSRYSLGIMVIPAHLIIKKVRKFNSLTALRNQFHFSSIRKIAILKQGLADR